MKIFTELFVKIRQLLNGTSKEDRDEEEVGIQSFLLDFV